MIEQHNDKILIIDFGSQYTQLIARRVRENRVYCNILSCDMSIDVVREMKPKGIILSGGPASIYNHNPPSCSPDIMELGIPLLGICYGMQWLTHALGGKVAPTSRREYGKAELMIDDSSDLLKNIGTVAPMARASQRKTTVWMSHGDRIEKMPDGFRIIGHTQNSHIAAMKHETRPWYALQFHPEVVHTPEGTKILKNFLFNVCHTDPGWTMRAYLEKTVEEIQDTVQDRKAICALSGGVDSAVAAALIQKAIGNRLTCVFSTRQAPYWPLDKRVPDRSFLRSSSDKTSFTFNRYVLGISYFG